MESIGVKIRAHREEKGYSLDQVARDTHITKRFLEAIEEENFSALPGESYVVGFLRSYAEYLGLDAADMVSLYQNMKLQEQPAPMTELLEKRRISAPLLIVLIVIGLGAVGGGAYYLYTSSQEPAPVQAGNQIVRVPQVSAVSFLNDTTEEREYAFGESVKVVIGGQTYEMRIGYRNNLIELEIGGTPVAIPADKTFPLDLNQDGVSDIGLLIKGVNTATKPGRVIISLTRLAEGAGVADSNLPAGQEAANTSVPTTLPAGGAVSGAAILTGTQSLVPAGQTNQTARIKPNQVIPEYTDLTRIAVSVRFDGLSSIRFESDNATRVERLAQAGEPVDIVGQNSVRLWLGNAGRATLRLGSRVFRAGQDGEVVALQFSWSTDPTKPRQLVMSPLY